MRKLVTAMAVAMQNAPTIGITAPGARPRSAARPMPPNAAWETPCPMNAMRLRTTNALRSAPWMAIATPARTPGQKREDSGPKR